MSISFSNDDHSSTIPASEMIGANEETLKIISDLLFCRNVIGTFEVRNKMKEGSNFQLSK